MQATFEKILPNYLFLLSQGIPHKIMRNFSLFHEKSWEVNESHFHNFSLALTWMTIR